MKLILVFILLFCFFTLKAQQLNKNEFSLKGHVDYKENRNIYFVYYDSNEERFLDSAKVINGNFYYQGVSNGYLDRFYVKSNPDNKNNNDSLNNVKIPIDNSEMNLELKNGHFSEYKLVGCKSCDLLDSLDKSLNTFSKKSFNYQKIINDSSIEKFKKINYQKLDDENWKLYDLTIINWCIKHISNNLTPLLLLSQSNNLTDKKLENFFSELDTFQKNSFYGLVLKKTVEFNYFKNHQLGKPAFLFEQLGYDSTLVSLKEVNNKNYVLLDFWASWCVPCRAGHPQLKKIFEKYQDSNFKIIGIADDLGENNKWKNAIKADSVYKWQQILNYQIKPKENIYNVFYVKYIPTKILIDMNGKIIGRFDSDNFSALEAKLKEIYKF